MGQLEKYGLYVLCLVIFLILGVTIWGDGGTPPARRAPATTGLNAAAVTTGDTVRPPGTDASVPNLQALLQPAVRPVNSASRDVQPIDASTGRLNAGAGSVTELPTNEAATKPSVTPPAEPAVAARPTYKVGRGDSFDSIARQKLGRASLRSEIARLNPTVRPESLQVGQVLVLPTAAELAPTGGGGPSGAGGSAGTVAAADPVVSYTVGKGDTYEGIARRQLGDRKRVADLRELNPGVDPTRLRVGQKIRLPKK